jgi:hypothetical protein
MKKRLSIGAAIAVALIGLAAGWLTYPVVHEPQPTDTFLIGTASTNQQISASDVLAWVKTNQDVYISASNNVLLSGLPSAPFTNIYVVNNYSTNLYSTIAFVTNLYSSVAYITNVYVSVGYVTNLYTSIAYITNVYVSIGYVTNLYSTTSYITNLYSTTAYVTNLYSSTAFITNLYSTTAYITNLYAISNYVKQGYITNLYVNNLYITNQLILAQTTWTGPTNTLDFSLGVNQQYTTTTDLAVTNFANAVAAGYDGQVQLWVTNSTAADHVLYITATGLTANDGARSYTITNKSHRVISFNKNDMGYHAMAQPWF